MKIEELCFYSLILDSYSYFYCEKLYLDCQLMYCGYNSMGQKVQKKHLLFSSLSSCTLQLSNIHSCLNEYLSIQFDSHHFCQFSGSVHTMLMEFKSQPDSKHKDVYQFIREECPNDTKLEFDQVYKTYDLKIREQYYKRMNYLNTISFKQVYFHYLGF